MGDRRHPEPERSLTVRRIHAARVLTIVAIATVAATGAPAGRAAAAVASNRETLGGVSCPTATTCFAVGISASSTSERTLVERWNGKTWAKVPSPNVAGHAINVLSNVACATATSCFADGFSSTTLSGKGTGSLMERWNGKTWSILATPGAVSPGGLACTSATNCFAVGEGIERWNGKAWSVVKTPKPVFSSDVTCATSTSCIAVGASSARWNGQTWSVVPTPQPGDPGSDFFALDSVACMTPSNCLALGLDSEPINSFSTLAEHWNGRTWSLLGPDALANAPGADLGTVTCPTATDCFVVGGSDPVAVDRQHVTAYHWDGTTFTPLTTPSFGAGNSYLNDVSCSSATNCFGVGALSRPYFGDLHTLIEHWNGTTWSVSGPQSRATS